MSTNMDKIGQETEGHISGGEQITDDSMAKGQKEGRKWTFYWKAVLFLTILDLVLNILARIPAVCDIYTDHFFWIWAETYGRVTGIFPISVGEILLILAIVYVLIWLFSLILLIFLHKRMGYRNYIQHYSKSVLAFGLFVLLIMTLNCSMLYGCSKLDIKGHRNAEYTASDIQKLWNYVVSQCNQLSAEVERDAQGNPVYRGDREEAVRLAMQDLASDYPRFRGWYPHPKPIHFSYIMYQAYCTGVYFPFSMEANYNSYLSELSYCATTAHELSHLKGYIYEDEADFMAYLACTGSEDPFLQYSGYLSVLGYLQSDYLDTEPDPGQEIALLDQVYTDSANYTYTEEVYEEMESTEPVFDQKTVETFSEGITDTYMDYYDATPNYEEVTKLMLAYYDGILY
ncbi:MAG: DUF3810 domain-containing protein [Lachnospiraceae bacterium]|nr:DUF3810 domain-containing protein [Lachnospiraceae bacterium]